MKGEIKHYYKSIFPWLHRKTGNKMPRRRHSKNSMVAWLVSSWLRRQMKYDAGCQRHSRGSESKKHAWHSLSWWMAQTVLEWLMTKCLESANVSGCSGWDMLTSTCSRPWKWARQSCIWCAVLWAPNKFRKQWLCMSPFTHLQHNQSCNVLDALHVADGGDRRSMKYTVVVHPERTRLQVEIQTQVLTRPR